MTILNKKFKLIFIIIENILSRQKKNLFINKNPKYHEKNIKENNKGDISWKII